MFSVYRTYQSLFYFPPTKLLEQSLMEIIWIHMMDFLLNMVALFLCLLVPSIHKEMECTLFLHLHIMLNENPVSLLS